MLIDERTLTLDREKANRVIRERGLKKRAVADGMKINRATLSRYLNGKANAPESMVKLMSLILGVDVAA